MSEYVKCPVCSLGFAGKPLKTWKFRFYNVKRFECARCKAKFNIYESPSSKFTIPKSRPK